jgi:hypothetical protein
LLDRPVHELTLELPEPPSLNRMIDLAKQRTRRSRTGGFMKRALPVVYDQAKETYELECLAAVRTAKVRLPVAPWARWTIESVELPAASAARSARAARRPEMDVDLVSSPASSPTTARTSCSQTRIPTQASHGRTEASRS